MSAQTLKREENLAPLPGYHSILIAVDSSDHSNRGQQEGAALARLWNAEVTGAHVYAAKLHDIRFRQMEGGLPEQFRDESELERQRDVHDDLITRGLSIITDSYLDHTERAMRTAGLALQRRALEGKNYRELVREVNGGKYDLLIMGALGLGAVQGSRLGTVCSRVARRSGIDTLVIKEPARALADGPIVVAVDGSKKSYGGLVTALALAQHWRVPVKVVAAFDPYYHYVAFNRIAGVLSEEAGKVFRFKDQEKLHEEIIDSGLAKIYQGHLDVAESVARDHGVTVETVLLDGKPNDAIAKYLREVKPSLLVIGKLGIHADAELDIGGNAEHLLHDADCAVLLSQREYEPELDVVASVTTSWTNEADERMKRVPSFVRNMARMAILRYAQERGHTVITGRIVEEATAALMPNHAEQAMAEIVEAHDAGDIGRKPAMDAVMRWSDAATSLLLTVQDLALRGNLSMRAEKKARQEDCPVVERHHIAAFLQEAAEQDSCPAGETPLHWEAAALARLMRVPEGFMRDKSKERIETHARHRGLAAITLEVCEAGLAEARKSMEAAAKEGDSAAPAAGKCPFGHGAGSMAESSGAANGSVSTAIPWEQAALDRLEEVPLGYCRNVTRNAMESLAAKNGLASIDLGFFEQVLGVFASGASTAQETMEWDDLARGRITRAPDMVRGMLIREIEGWAKRHGLERVDSKTVNIVKNEWRDGGLFHLDPDDARNRS